MEQSASGEADISSASLKIPLVRKTN
jgi:hypothetical protein